MHDVAYERAFSAAATQVHGVLLSLNALVAANLPQPDAWLPELVSGLSQRSWLLSHSPACSLAVQAEYVRSVQAACTLAAGTAGNSAIVQQAQQLHETVASLLRKHFLHNSTFGSTAGIAGQRHGDSAENDQSASEQQQLPVRGTTDSTPQSTAVDPMWVQFAKQALSFLLPATSFHPAGEHSAGEAAPVLPDSRQPQSAVQPAAAQPGVESADGADAQLAQDARSALQSRHYEVRAACLKLLARRSAGAPDTNTETCVIAIIPCCIIRSADMSKEQPLCNTSS